MKNLAGYALPHSDLNAFLFAVVGKEASGMTLSVLSAFARLGLDPWQEAGRLAGLPAKAAIQGLARMIAAMPASPWALPDATTIAERLIPLLPVRRAAGLLPSGPAVAGRPVPVNWILTIALMAAALVVLALIGTRLS